MMYNQPVSYPGRDCVPDGPLMCCRLKMKAIRLVVIEVVFRVRVDTTVDEN